MKFLKDNIVAILFIFIAVVLTIMVVNFFRKTPLNAEIEVLKVEGKHKEEMRLKDSVYFTERIASKDSVILILQTRTAEKQIQYVQLKTDEKKIRPTVESYSNNELLRRANGWVAE